MSIVLSVVNGPSSQKKGNDQDGKRNEDLGNFFLIICKHKGTAKNQSEPVEGNAQGEESVAEVEEEHQEDMKHTKHCCTSKWRLESTANKVPGG